MKKVILTLLLIVCMSSYGKNENQGNGGNSGNWGDHENADDDDDDDDDDETPNAPIDNYVYVLMGIGLIYSSKKIKI